ncbi:hypothetical protein ES703_41495 [subsurface metagenome]
MYSVSACSAADDDNQISTLRILEAFVFIHQADVAAEDQWISEVSVVEVDRTVDSWYSHSVTVVSDAGHDALHNPSRMQDAFGDVFQFLIWRSETKYIRVGDGFRAQAGSHWVADYAADAGGCTAVRVERRGVIVGFDLKTNRRILIELDHARIVGKYRYTPLFIEFFGGFENGLF